MGRQLMSARKPFLSFGMSIAGRLAFLLLMDFITKDDQPTVIQTK